MLSIKEENTMDWKEVLTDWSTKKGLPFPATYSMARQLEKPVSTNIGALNWAADENHPDLVKALLEIGAGCEDALLWAAQKAHLECLKILLDAGLRDKGMSLCLAAQNGHVECVKMLLDAGVRSASALEWAVTGFSSATRNIECLKTLLDAGIRDEGESLTKAMQCRNLEMAKLLTEAWVNTAKDLGPEGQGIITAGLDFLRKAQAL